MMDEFEWKLCKTIGKDFYVCKQRHPLLSSHLLGSCAVKFLQPRRNIPSNRETRVIHLAHTLWIQLKDNSWIYYAPFSGTVTVLCGKDDPMDVTVVGVGKFSMRQGRKAYSDSTVLQTNLIVMSNETSKKGDFLSQVPLQYECCEELGVDLKLFDMPMDTPYTRVGTLIVATLL